MRRATLLLTALLWPLAAGAAEPLVADLSDHKIDITAGFSGKDVVLFGATDGPGDVIVVVTGPLRDTAVRRKSKVAGIFINTRQVIFTAAPSYYAIYSTRPLDDIMPPATRALHEIGLANLRLSVADQGLAPQDIADFRAALLRERHRENLFVEEVAGFNILGDRLFHLGIKFPANVPTGQYRFLILLVRNKQVVGAQTSPLEIAQAGIDAEVNDFAARQALAYGLIAVAGAAMAGWLASLPFRNA